MNTYLLLKALHVAAMLFWMAALLYLPRLFVYHAEALEKESAQDRDARAPSETPPQTPPETPAETQEPMASFIVMERRLLRAIANPAMIATLALGLGLAASGQADIESGWFGLKVLLLLPLFAFHGFCAKWRRLLARASRVRGEVAPDHPSARFFRRVNEIPAVLALLIILLAVAKPL